MQLRSPSLLLLACAACAPSAAPVPPPCLGTPTPSAAPIASAAATYASPSAPSPPATPAPPPPTLPQAFDVAAIDDYLARLVPTRDFVGLSVAVVTDGKIVLQKGYGRRSLAPDLPAEADTPFLVGSITKQFVAALVLKLAEEKKLTLEDKVAKYFPDLTARGRHHALRPPHPRLRLPRQRSAALRRPRAQSGDHSGREHCPLCEAAARFRAPDPLLLQQHGVQDPRPRRREGHRQASRRRPHGAHLPPPRHDALVVHAGGRDRGSRHRLHHVYAGPGGTGGA